MRRLNRIGQRAAWATCLLLMTGPILLGQERLADAANGTANTEPRRGDRAWLLPLPEVIPDPSIPTLNQVVGHDWAVEISSPDQIEQYLNALTKAAPDRTRLVRYGATFEERPLHYLVITSPKNLRRLDEIQKNNLLLADPRRLTEDEARNLIPNQPAIVWLAYGVHGNEISSCDAALLTAYTLLADTRPETRDRLEDVVVVIDPSQNPDGRARFLATHRQGHGVYAAPEPFAAERTEPWPGGRYNHYLFDMNRDWYLQSQVETRDKVAAYLQWQPQIYVDAHEMGANNNYYFDPPSDPINGQITPTQIEWFMKIGRKQGDRFDQYGFPYTSRETYDGFYPGYGSTWPTMHGALGILWEQASARGLVVDRDDETSLHYHDGVRHHYVSSLVTIEAAAENKDAMLAAFRANRASAIENGRARSSYDYFLLPGDTPARAARLARLLVANGLEVFQLADSGRVALAGSDGEPQQREVPAGTYLVPAAQPAGRLARTLLEPADDMGEAFINRQLDRKARRLGDEIYDVTAWSVPLSFGVECLQGRALVEPRSTAIQVDSKTPPGVVEGPEQPRVGYLVHPADDSAPIALASWLRQGLRVHVVDQPFVLGGVDYPRGTLLLRLAQNPETLPEIIRADAERLGLHVVGIDSTFVDSGAGLGGSNVTWVKPPRILLAVGEAVTPFIGHTWYLFDQVWGYPTTRVQTRYLSRALAADQDFNVLVLPSGSYGPASGMSGSTLDQLKQWVRAGGTLILLGSATEWATSEDVGLIASKPREKTVDPIPGEGLDAPEPPAAPIDPDSNEKPDTEEPKPDIPAESSSDQPTESPDPVPGAFLQATIYDDHWVGFGLPGSIPLLVNTSLILDPIKPTDGRNLVTFPSQASPISGFVWPKTLELIGRSPYVVYQDLGDGHVIGFTDDPNYRALSPVTQRLFLNAVLFSPGH